MQSLKLRRSSTDDEGQWVEKTIEESKCSESRTSSASQSQSPLKRDDWMNNSELFSCISRGDIKKKRNERKDDKQERFMLNKLEQNNRELNPYWRNGGNGLPQIENKTVGSEVDVMWLKKSLRRAYEQAKEEGRTIDEVAAERWGSISTIESMISNAESKSSDVYNNESDQKQIKTNKDFICKKDGKHYHKQDRLDFNKDKYRNYKSNSQERRKHRSRSKSYERDDGRNLCNRRLKSKEHNNYDTHRNERNEKRPKLTFKKPAEYNYSSSMETTNSVSIKTKSWQKPEIRERNYNQQMEEVKIKLESSRNVKVLKTEESAETKEHKVLTEAEMNQLGARIVKAEIMGDEALAMQLKMKLERAREMYKNASAKLTENEKEETIILTETNIEGMTRPLERRSQYEERLGGRKRKNNVETHTLGQRIRYFPDDDKYTLQQMYEKAKFTNEEDEVFVKIASKNADMDDTFEQVCCNESDAKQDNRYRTRAIKQHKNILRSLDSCRFCIDTKHMLKHMIIAIGSEVYLSLPPHTSLNTSHCILAPIHHVMCQTQLDENVWNELQIFKKTLTKMFTDRNEIPIFFEVFMGRHKFPHMQLECVALSKAIGDMAPIYFKKALLECETEWSINKKVVDLSQKDVRHAVPKGLSYFAINFGMDGGFAHVIEDENIFPKNFAQEIIGGMLDLDHSVWRKPKKEEFDQLTKKVMEFTEMWKKYDFIVNNKSE